MEDAVASGGSAGLFSLIALVLALEARLFVLTTASNWSQLLDRLRRVRLDPACGGCTDAVDLMPASSASAYVEKIRGGDA